MFVHTYNYNTQLGKGNKITSPRIGYINILYQATLINNEIENLQKLHFLSSYYLMKRKTRFKNNRDLCRIKTWNENRIPSVHLWVCF